MQHGPQGPLPEQRGLRLSFSERSSTDTKLSQLSAECAPGTLDSGHKDPLPAPPSPVPQIVDSQGL